MNIDNDLRNEILNFSVDSKAGDNCFKLYIYILMYANFKDNTINGIDIKRGQHLTSISVLAEKTGLSEKNVRTAITALVKAGYIKQYATKGYSIITACHYDKKKKAESKTAAKAEDVTTVEEKPKGKDEAYYNHLLDMALERPLTPEEQKYINEWED